MHLSEAIAYLIPQLGSPFSLNYGGEQLGKNFQGLAQWLRSSASVLDALSASAGLEARFQRRSEEWNYQLVQAEQQLEQNRQQIEAAKIREEIAQKELEIHKKNVEQSEEQYEFIRDKFTGLGLYSWQATHLTRLHRQAYNLALETANRALRAYTFETGDETIDIENDGWERDKAGLLAGERLMLQLQRLEQAFYSTSNERKLEITKHVSLAMLNPMELMRLRETGTCHIDVPEVLFDLDFPGHCNRRIKSVSLTVPCVTGPYTGVSTQLTLEGHYIRQEANADELTEPDYEPVGRAIATSSAQNDSGMFQLNFRDERYLPFEGAGAVSRWTLELPSTFRAFDYDTISDVILHINYTAEDCGDTLIEGLPYKQIVAESLQADVNAWLEGIADGDTGLSRLFSLRHVFPSEWHRFASGEEGSFEATIKKTDFPYFVQDRDIEINEVELYAVEPGVDPAARDIDLGPVGFDDSDEFALSISRDDMAWRDGVHMFLLFRYALG